jgi:GNAT superfamily N-acetyltransferase
MTAETGPNTGDGTVVTRRATEVDLPDVLALLRQSLGWVDADPRFLEWKHLRNPFGPSPMWVALVGERVVGFRAFLRWELVTATGRVVSAARAVDTATHPDFQGRGIFRRLTLAALDSLASDGVELVFNTPNHRSLPGYLSMGWAEVGRLPAAVRPARWRFAAVVATARTAAGRDSVPCTLGVPAATGLADVAALERLLDRLPPAAGVTTRRTAPYLAWRYGNPDLGYRALLAGASAADGMLLFRLRRRGAGVEGVVDEVLAPAGDQHVGRGLLDRFARSRHADYLIRLDAAPGVTRDRFWRLPQVGPVLVCRALVDAPLPEHAGWALSMGDVELL